MELWPAALVIQENAVVVRCFGQLDSELTCSGSLRPSSGDRLQAVQSACLRWDTLTGLDGNRTTPDILMLISSLRLRRCPRNVCRSVADGVTTGTMLCVKFRPAQFVKSTSKLLTRSLKIRIS